MKRLFCLMVLLAPSAMLGQPARPLPGVKVWEWTLEQRLAARFDEVDRNRRIDAYEAGLATRHGKKRADAPDIDSSRPPDIVHGRDHPELFMPFEVFTIFIRETYGADDVVAADSKRQYAAEASTIGLPADFIDTVQVESSTFITQLREEMALRTQIFTGKHADPPSGMARVHEIEKRECRSRAEAMRSLRRLFGSRFDQFLYSVIAPNAFIDFFRPVTAQELREKEEGCR